MKFSITKEQLITEDEGSWWKMFEKDQKEYLRSKYYGKEIKSKMDEIYYENVIRLEQ